MIETILIFIIVIGLILQTMKKPKNFPPGPLLLPLVGHMLVLDRVNPQICWNFLRKRYGDIVGLMVPNFKFLLVSGWDSITEALAHEDLLGRPDVCLLRDRFDGGRYGIVFQDGPDWRTQRRFTLHHFRNLGFGRKSHELVIMEEADNLVKELVDLGGVPVTMEDKFALSAINITWCLLGGKRYERSDPLLKDLAYFVKESMHSVKVTGGVAVVWPFIRYVFPSNTGYASIKYGSKGILEFVKRAIEEHYKENPDDIAEDDFIGIYLKEMNKVSQNDKSFSRRQLEGLCVDLLSAGADTSSSVLSFALLFLCLDEGNQEKIFKEIQNFVGTEKFPSTDDRPSLVYTDAFLSEVLRYRTVTPTFPPHRALKDCSLGGYSIPKDTVVLLNYESVTNDTEYWGDPQNFRPERFITEEGKFRKDERLITFGKGKRSCLGETLAKMISFLILSTLVQRFTFRFPAGEFPKDTEGTQGFTLAPPEFRVVATPRKL